VKFRRRVRSKAKAPGAAGGRKAAAALTGLALMVLIFGTAAGQGDEGGDDEKSTDWRVGYDNQFDGKINVFKSQLSSSYFVFTQVYDTFPYNWRLSDTGPDKENSLVTSHEISEDGLVFTFHMRKGVKWNDGEDLTADDVVFTYNAYKDAKQNVLAGYVSNMDKIEAIDDYTVRYTLKRPDARVLSAYTPLLPEHIWGDQPLDEIHAFDPCCPIVGSGPFTITELDPKGTTILTPNEYFWGRKGEVERILMIKYGEKEGQLRDIKLNRLDAVLYGDSKWVTDIEEDPNLTAWSVPTPGFVSIAFNMCPPGGGPPQNTCSGPAEGVKWQVVQDLAIRQALSWAIDRENLVETVYAGQAEPGNGFISPYYKRYFESYEGDPEIGYTYDPEKARAILAEGGWDCPTGGICQKDGIKAEFELLVRSEDKEGQNAVQRIKAWAKDIGIQINVSIITADALIARNYETSPEDKSLYEPNYDAFLWGWGGDLPSPDFNFEVTLCGSYWSDTFYCNPDEYDPLPTRALQELDFDERVDLLHQAERVVLRDTPYIILVHNNDIAVTRNDTWTGYHPSPEPNGYPVHTSWLQLSLLEPGQKASAAYAGAPAVLVVLFLGIVAAVATSFWRRHKEETGPLELPEPAVGGGS
jgi:peptide/nickel transport system substrate-binding protein